MVNYRLKIWEIPALVYPQWLYLEDVVHVWTLPDLKILTCQIYYYTYTLIKNIFIKLQTFLF